MGSSCIYVVFMAENLKAVSLRFSTGLMRYYYITHCQISIIRFQVVDVYVGVDTDIRLYMCILLFPLWLTTSLKDFKVLAPFSTVVTSMTIGAFGIIFYYIFRDLSLLKLRNKVGTASNIPLAFGTVLFAMEAIGAVSTDLTTTVSTLAVTPNEFELYNICTSFISSFCGQYY